MNIDIRNYIIGNFKNDSISEIETSINDSISSNEEDILLGLGVLFELIWNNCDKDTKNIMLRNIKVGIDTKNKY